MKIIKYCSNCGKEIIGESCPYCVNNTNNLSTNNTKALKKGNASLILIIIPYIIGFICGIGGMFFGFMINDIFKLDLNYLQIILFYVSFMPIVFFPLLIISTILSIISLRKCYNTKAIIALILDILPIIIYSFIFLYTAS